MQGGRLKLSRTGSNRARQAQIEPGGELHVCVRAGSNHLSRRTWRILVLEAAQLDLSCHPSAGGYPPAGPGPFELFVALPPPRDEETVSIDVDPDATVGGVAVLIKEQYSDVSVKIWRRASLKKLGIWRGELALRLFEKAERADQQWIRLGQA
eukprot:gene15144-biopygen11374